MRVASRLDLEPLLRIRVRRLTVRVWEALQLEKRALEDLLSLAADLPTMELSGKDLAEISRAVLDDLGRVTFALGDWERSLTAYQRLRTQGQESPRIGWMIAQCHFASKNYRETIQELEKVRASSNDLELLKQARGLEGDAYEALGLFEQALQTWRELDR